MIVRIQHVDIGHYGILFPLEINLEREELILVTRNTLTGQETRHPLDLKAAVERDKLKCGCQPTEK